MDDSNDQAPDFGPSSLPGVAALLAALKGGEFARGAAGRAFEKTQEKIPKILAEASTPLAELAEFTKQEVRVLTDFAASRGITAKIVAAGPNEAVAFSEIGESGTSILGRLLNRIRPGSAALGVDQIGLKTTSMPVAMHELGHAAPILGSSTIRDAWRGMADTLAGGIPGKALRALLIANSFSPESEDNGVREFARRNAPALIGATYLPELLEEARATTSALRGSSRYGLGVAEAARQLLPAFGTYASHAAAPVIGTLIAQKIMNAIRNRGEEKQAAATVGKEIQSPGILRASASSAWRMGVSAPKPKSIKPNASMSAKAKETTKAKPPSKTAFYSDVVKSLNNPQRGFRQAKLEP